MTRVRRERRASFADLVRALPPPDPDEPRAETIGSPLAGRTWTDADGVTWSRRGGDLPARRVRELLEDAAVRVVRAAPDGVGEVAPSDRPGLWRHVGPRLRGEPRDAGDHLDVRAGELRAPDGARLLVLEERC